MAEYKTEDIIKTFAFYMMDSTKISPSVFYINQFSRNNLFLGTKFSKIGVFDTTIQNSYTVASKRYWTSTEKFIFNNAVTKMMHGSSQASWRISVNVEIPHYIYYKSVSSIFKQTVLNSYTTSNTSALLGYTSANWAVESNSIVSVQLLNGWEYSSEENSQKAIHYIMKIETSGNNASAKLIFKKFPYMLNNPLYLQTSGKSMYSEFVRIYLLNTNTIKQDFFISEPAYDINNGFSFSPGFRNNSKPVGIWCESRRKDIDNSETNAVTMLLSDATHLTTYNHFVVWPPETLHTFTFAQNIKQCTYFYGKYIVLGEDMKVYYLMPEGTLQLIIDTEIDNSESVFLVSHPDQDYCYLLGGSKQIIMDRDLNYVVVDSAWSGISEGLRFTNFDSRGRVWVGAQCRAKATLEIVRTIAEGGICNFTYFAGSLGNCYNLDGELLNNVPITFNSYVLLSNLIWKYPQAVEVPFSEEDFYRIHNRNVWYGRNVATGALEIYDNTNAIPITDDGVGNECVELSDGVKVVIDDAGGTLQLHANDYIYFTVAQGMIKDELNKVELMVHDDIRNFFRSTDEWTISSANHNVKEYDDADFIYLDTTVFDCAINNVPAAIITSGSPTKGQVLIVSTGTLTFHTSDIGLIAKIEYYVAKDPYVA